MVNLELPVSQLLAQLQSGEISSLQLTQSCLDRIEKRNEELGTFLLVNADGALAKAEAVDHCTPDRFSPRIARGLTHCS